MSVGGWVEPVSEAASCETGLALSSLATINVGGKFQLAASFDWWQVLT